MRETRDYDTKCNANIGNMHLKTRHIYFTYGLGLAGLRSSQRGPLFGAVNQRFHEQKPKFPLDKRVMLYSRQSECFCNNFEEQMSI